MNTNYCLNYKEIMILTLTLPQCYLLSSNLRLLRTIRTAAIFPNSFFFFIVLDDVSFNFTFLIYYIYPDQLGMLCTPRSCLQSLTV